MEEDGKRDLGSARSGAVGYYVEAEVWVNRAVDVRSEEHGV